MPIPWGPIIGGIATLGAAAIGGEGKGGRISYSPPGRISYSPPVWPKIASPFSFMPPSIPGVLEQYSMISPTVPVNFGGQTFAVPRGLPLETARIYGALASPMVIRPSFPGAAVEPYQPSPLSGLLTLGAAVGPSLIDKFWPQTQPAVSTTPTTPIGPAYTFQRPIWEYWPKTT